MASRRMHARTRGGDEIPARCSPERRSNFRFDSHLGSGSSQQVHTIPCIDRPRPTAWTACSDAPRAQQPSRSITAPQQPHEPDGSKMLSTAGPDPQARDQDGAKSTSRLSSVWNSAEKRQVRKCCTSCCFWPHAGLSPITPFPASCAHASPCCMQDGMSFPKGSPEFPATNSQSKRREAAAWIQTLTGTASLQHEDERSFRAALADGALLCSVANVLCPDSIKVLSRVAQGGPHGDGCCAAPCCWGKDAMQHASAALMCTPAAHASKHGRCMHGSCTQCAGSR